MNIDASGSTPEFKVDPKAVFLNVPYDKEFRSLYVAFIVGLMELGLEPKATLQLSKSPIRAQKQRLDKIFELIQSCAYSFHDLSRVELDSGHPPTPRFNMPFELGLALGWAKWTEADGSGVPKHEWFVSEAVDRRAFKSISDLNGYDCHIHDNKPGRLLAELCNAFTHLPNPGVPTMMQTYDKVRKGIPALLSQTKSKSVYTASMFNSLILLTKAIIELRSDPPKAT